MSVAVAAPSLHGLIDKAISKRYGGPPASTRWRLGGSRDAAAAGAEKNSAKRLEIEGGARRLIACPNPTTGLARLDMSKCLRKEGLYGNLAGGLVDLLVWLGSGCAADGCVIFPDVTITLIELAKEDRDAKNQQERVYGNLLLGLQPRFPCDQRRRGHDRLAPAADRRRAMARNVAREGTHPPPDQHRAARRPYFGSRVLSRRRDHRPGQTAGLLR